MLITKEEWKKALENPKNKESLDSMEKLYSVVEEKVVPVIKENGLESFKDLSNLYTCITSLRILGSVTTTNRNAARLLVKCGFGWVKKTDGKAEEYRIFLEGANGKKQI